MTNRCSPAHALWKRIGRARAARFPGWFGDMLLAPEEVARVLEEARAIAPIEKFEDAEHARAKLVEALETAIAEGVGVLAVNGTNM